MWESLARMNAVVGGVVWGPVGLALLFGTGCLLTVRTGFFQLRYFGYWMRHTIGAIFLDRNVTAHTDDEAISQFQSLCTALAATIGTGNIVGVAAAILAGGPGAVFWMWVMALLGMMTSYAENVLGICYRRRDAAGRWCGGPMYYLAEGLGGGFGRALAVLFACFCVLASFGMGNMSQINSIAGNLQAVFRVPPVATGIVLALLTGRVILGGLKRVAAVTEAIVPLMALFYLFGALTVVCVHWAAVPAAFAAIFRGAFGLQAVCWVTAWPGPSAGDSSGEPFPTKQDWAHRCWCTARPTWRSLSSRECGECSRCLQIPWWSAPSRPLWYSPAALWIWTPVRP